ncbi:MAG: phosphate signaling complex protein PhoU [Candidatus Aminicenantes bacterium]|nr:phosphate signaling complex protein PhoU [Candidatus Aminicenantes bacterium]
MKRHLDIELTELQKLILTMSSLTEESIARSLAALLELNTQKAQTVIAEDIKVNELEVAIDDKCLHLIALYQPAAMDLRFIAMAMKMCTDLERIADLAVNICQRVLDIAGLPQLKPLIDIPKLAALAQSMLRDAVDAFVNRDVDLAKRVILRDDEADNLRNLVQSELVADYLGKDTATAPRAVALILVARYLERICDHTTNIAEDVIYMVKAALVKHHPEVL